MTYLHLHVVTYNVAGIELSRDDVETLFKPQRGSELGDFLDDTDILVVGLQEAYHSAMKSAIPLIGKDSLVDTFSEYLCLRGFARLQFSRLLGILTMVFLKRPLLCYANDVQVATLRTGFGGLWGNKGASSIHFKLGDISVVFTNCHLVPHEENNERRSIELNEIMDAQTFQDGERSVKLLDHDLTVLFGDLNYRLEGIPYEQIVSSLAHNDKVSLFKSDQLRLEQVKGDNSPSFLHHFMEMEVEFEPSYKYQLGCDRFDMSKGRPPAWCDRVLWAVHDRRYPKVTDAVPMSLIKPVVYERHNQLKVSDHRPISCRLDVLVNINADPRVAFRMNEWVSNAKGVIEFDIMPGTDVSFWDWIGLYPHNFISVESDHVFWTFTPAIRGTVASIQHYKKPLGPDKVTFSPGLYVLVYYSSFYKSVSGMSPVFRITAAPSE